MYEVRANRAEDFDAINEVIHDCWFWADDVAFDKATRTLRVRFKGPASRYLESKRTFDILELLRAWWSEWILEIANVESYELTESEGVGRYPFNELRYSAPDDVLIIDTCIPLTFLVTVDAVDVVVREIEKS